MNEQTPSGSTSSGARPAPADEKKVAELVQPAPGQSQDDQVKGGGGGVPGIRDR